MVGKDMVEDIDANALAINESKHQENDKRNDLTAVLFLKHNCARSCFPTETRQMHKKDKS